MKFKYSYYVCKCGSRIIPFSNPCKCPNCGRVTFIKTR